MPYLRDVICLQIPRSLENLRTAIEKRVELFGAQYIAFGVFGILNYPIFYLIWFYYNTESYESLFLRSLATLLCLLLLLKNYWPKKLKSWLPVYWYFTLIFCLPFFFFFMLFKNHASNVWLMSSNTILFWLLLMVDWVSYVFVFSIGFILACIFYIITTPEFSFDIHEWWGIAAQFIASFIVVLFFAHKKQVFDKQQLKAMSSMGGMIAHEIRTPLAAIKITLDSWKTHFFQLIKGYKIYASEHDDTTLRPDRLEAIEKAFDGMKRSVGYADNTIHTILTGFHYAAANHVDEIKSFDINNTIQSAIEQFPFNEEERSLVKFNINPPVQALGNPVIIIHVLHNLLKNSLHVIKEAGKGTISIWVEQNKAKVYLYFEDNAKGISKKHIKHIFEPFYTTKKETAASIGLGLYFCRLALERMKAEIFCDSREGKYTRFTIILQKAKNNN